MENVLQHKAHTYYYAARSNLVVQIADGSQMENDAKNEIKFIFEKRFRALPHCCSRPLYLPLSISPFPFVPLIEIQFILIGAMNSVSYDMCLCASAVR